MTGPAPTTELARSRRSAYVSWLLEHRRDNALRAELRRGATPALADRALPYLARWIRSGWESGPTLLFAAAVMQHTGIGQADGVSLGRATYRCLDNAQRRDPQESNLGNRIVSVQRQQLLVAHRFLDGVFAALDDERIGLDWHALWWNYRAWDHPDLDRRRQVRRQLLLDFFAGDPRAAVTPTL